MANLMFWQNRPKNPNITKAEIMDDLGAVETIPNGAAMSGSYDEPLPAFTYSTGPVNLLRMITDHAPARLELIEQSIAAHQRQIEQLQEESIKLNAVLKAVEHG